MAARRRVGARAGAAAQATRRKSAAARTSKAAPKATQPDSREIALAVAQVALDQKALNVEIIDVRGKVDYSDYVVVMAGRSDRHDRDLHPLGGPESTATRAASIQSDSRS